MVECLQRMLNQAPVPAGTGAEFDHLEEYPIEYPEGDSPPAYFTNNAAGSDEGHAAVTLSESRRCELIKALSVELECGIISRQQYDIKVQAVGS